MTWSLLGSWDHGVSGNTASPIDFTGLSGSRDILIIAQDVTLSVSGILGVQLSVNNGSSFFTTSGDYISLNDAGVSTNQDQIRMYSTAATAARSAHKLILACNLSGVPKVDTPNEASRRHQFRGSTSPVDAVRVLASAGGNLTGGKLYVLGRT